MYAGWHGGCTFVVCDWWQPAVFKLQVSGLHHCLYKQRCISLRHCLQFFAVTRSRVYRRLPQSLLVSLRCKLLTCSPCDCYSVCCEWSDCVGKAHTRQIVCEKFWFLHFLCCLGWEQEGFLVLKVIWSIKNLCYLSWEFYFGRSEARNMRRELTN